MRNVGPFQPGDRCKDWEIVGLLGAGGYGCVYEAKREVLGFANEIWQPVGEERAALKCLQVRHAAEAGARDRLHQEGALLLKLKPRRHPNIVGYVDLGMSDSGVAFFAVDLLKGKTLTTQLEDGRMPVGDALKVAMAIADGLAVAHEHGIAHLDLKPCNVFLTEYSEVKVLDLGAAKYDYGWTRGTGASPGVRHREFTPGYAAPEQLDGSGVVDHRADIFSLGVILFEMLTGEHPFYGSDHVMPSLLHEAKSLEGFGIAEDLATIVQRALAKDAAERQASMAELRDAIRGAYERGGDRNNQRATKLSVEAQLRREVAENSAILRAPTVRVPDPIAIFKDTTLPDRKAVAELRAAVAAGGKFVLNHADWQPRTMQEIEDAVPIDRARSGPPQPSAVVTKNVLSERGLVEPDEAAEVFEHAAMDRARTPQPPPVWHHDSIIQKARILMPAEMVDEAVATRGSLAPRKLVRRRRIGVPLSAVMALIAVPGVWALMGTVRRQQELGNVGAASITSESARPELPPAAGGRRPVSTGTVVDTVTVPLSESRLSQMKESRSPAATSSKPPVAANGPARKAATAVAPTSPLYMVHVPGKKSNKSPTNLLERDGAELLFPSVQ